MHSMITRRFLIATPSRKRFCSTRWMMPTLTRSGISSCDERRVRLLEVIDQPLHILAAEDEVRRAFDALGKVRDQHRAGIDHRVTVDLRAARFSSSVIQVALMPKTGSTVGTPSAAPGCS